jgi:hypothetical protein
VARDVHRFDGEESEGTAEADPLAVDHNDTVR